MEFKTDEANLRAGSNPTGEIDLYDELVAFSNLSPENQSRGPAPRPVNDSEPAPQAAGGFVYSDLTHSDEAINEQTVGQEGQGSKPMEQPSFELIDRAGSRPAEELSTNPVEDSPFEPPYKPAAEMGRKPSSESPRAGESNHGVTADLDLAYLLRVTGPLVALGLTMNPGSSPLVCKDCRSQSSSKDMFCVNCGGLLESMDASEAATDETSMYESAVEAAAVRSVCDDCDYLIEDDEIFCPSCGAVI